MLTSVHVHLGSVPVRVKHNKVGKVMKQNQRHGVVASTEALLMFVLEET